MWYGYNVQKEWKETSQGPERFCRCLKNDRIIHCIRVWWVILYVVLEVTEWLRFELQNELNSWNATEWNWWQRECWKSVFLCLFIYIYNFNRKGEGGHRETMTMNSLKMHNEQWPYRQSFDLPIPSNSQRISGILWEFVILGVLSHLMTLSCRCSLLTAYDLPLERASPLAWCWFPGRWDCDRWQVWQLFIIY